MRPIAPLIIIGLLLSCETTKYVIDDKELQFESEVSWQDVSDNTMTINFTVNKACNCNLFYKVGSRLDSVFIEEYRQDHEILLAGLYPDQTYQIYFQLTEFYDDYRLLSDTFQVSTEENDFSRGWEHYNSGNFTTALDYFETYSAGNYLNPLVHSSIGWCELNLGNYDNAKTEFEKTDTLNALEELNLLGLMTYYQLTNDINQTIETGEKLIAIAPNWNYIYNTVFSTDLARLILAEMYYLNDNIGRSIDYLNQLTGTEIIVENSETWKFNGTNYNSLDDLIISVINFLKSES